MRTRANRLRVLCNGEYRIVRGWSATGPRHDCPGAVALPRPRSEPDPHDPGSFGLVYGLLCETGMTTFRPAMGWLLMSVVACSSRGGGAGNVGGAGNQQAGGAGGSSTSGTGGNAGASPGSPDAAAMDDASGATRGSGGAGGVGPLTVPAAFEVQATLTLKPDTNPGTVASPLPNSQDLLLYVDAVALTVQASVAGQTATAGLTTTDGASFATTGALGFRIPAIGCLAGGTCFVDLSYSSFHFTVSGRTLSGSAAGSALVFGCEAGERFAATLSFTGAPDMHGPALMVPPNPVDPLHPPTISASEPLPATAKAQLVSPVETIDLVRAAWALAPSSFVVPADRALRYDTQYQVVITPWQDLAGNVGGSLGSIVTSPAPALFGEDGFEGAAASVGGATIVGASVLPPISGNRSAVVSGPRNAGVVGTESPRLTVRMAVHPGAQVVRLSLRPWSRTQLADPVGLGNATFSIAAPGVPLVTQSPTGTAMLSTSIATGMSTVWAGEVIPLEIPLPTGALPEVVFDMSLLPEQLFCSVSPPAVSYLVDDLRVE